MSDKKLTVNRAPVLTLWATIVAERLGFDRHEALTLGRAVAGLNAQSKGQRLGIYEPRDKSETQRTRERSPGEAFSVDLLGRAVPAVNTEHGVRATRDGRPDDPAAAERYLEKKFGDSLPDVRLAMEGLADAFEPEELARRAYDLYEQFRPDIPSGKRGWGAQGELDLDRIRSLAPAHR